MRNGQRACRASAAGDEESVRLVRALVEMGLDPAACDQYDRTPLHLAACSGGLALLEFLLGLVAKDCKAVLDDSLRSKSSSYGFRRISLAPVAEEHSTSHLHRADRDSADPGFSLQLHIQQDEQSNDPSPLNSSYEGEYTVPFVNAIDRCVDIAYFVYCPRVSYL